MQLVKCAFEVAIEVLYNKNWSYDVKVAVGDSVPIRLQATGFGTFSYEQKRNVAYSLQICQHQT